LQNNLEIEPELTTMKHSLFMLGKRIMVAIKNSKQVLAQINPQKAMLVLSVTAGK